MRVVTFGEVMLRLMPPNQLRFSQSLPGELEATFGGAEVNVAVSIAQQGGEAAFCTSLPDNPLTDAFETQLRGFGVDTSLIERRSTGRFGIYFVENGANQRPGTVVYDRAGSSIALTPPEAYDWPTILAGASSFHTTGITPALSEAAFQAALGGVKTAKQMGLTVSCDLNFRKKLWNWQPGTSAGDLARTTIEQLLSSVDILIANEEDAAQVLGIQAADTNVEAGEIHLAGYADVARQIVARFPSLRLVAITLRESISASHNRWGALLFDATTGEVHTAPNNPQGEYAPYEITQIVDRVGAGDSFAGGLLRALQLPDWSTPAAALRYAVAASCLKHSIRGDYNFASRAEVEALAGGATSGRVQR